MVLIVGNLAVIFFNVLISTAYLSFVFGFCIVVPVQNFGSFILFFYDYKFPC